MTIPFRLPNHQYSLICIFSYNNIQFNLFIIWLSYGLDGPGFESREGQNSCIFSKMSTQALGHTQSSVQWVPWGRGGFTSLSVEIVAFRFATPFSYFRKNMRHGTLKTEAKYYSEILMPVYKAECCHNPHNLVLWIDNLMSETNGIKYGKSEIIQVTIIIIIIIIIITNKALIKIINRILLKKENKKGRSVRSRERRVE